MDNLTKKVQGLLENYIDMLEVRAKNELHTNNDGEAYEELMAERGQALDAVKRVQYIVDGFNPNAKFRTA
jgi:hypothetical protein